MYVSVPGKKKSVAAAILFKQNWSSDFEKKKSTRFRVFKTEAKREVGLLHSSFFTTWDHVALSTS